MWGWPFEDFGRHEFACRCRCGFDDIDLGLVTTLQALRESVARPVVIISGCRCGEHNARVGGSRFSQHTKGRAADIHVRGLSSKQVMDRLRLLYLQYKAYVGYVYEVSPRSLHVDVRTPESSLVRGWRRFSKG